MKFTRVILFSILGLSFLLRLAGIGYGLPLWVVDDEPPFTLAALKMIQLRTLIPAFHLDEFRTILYYPSYLSYLYLAPFSLLLAIKFLLFGGAANQFIYHLTSDLSQFFLVARFLNVAMGAASVFLVYRISKEIFKDEFTALMAAFFLGTSLLHIAFSFVGRHWLPISFFLALILMILSINRLNLKKKYILALLTAGIGLGISPILIISFVLIFSWYFFFDKLPLFAILKDKYFYLVFAILVASLLLPGVLYPQSFGFKGDLTLGQPKTVWGIIQSPFLFLKPVILSEPVLAMFAGIGLLAIFLRFRNLFWPIFIFIYSYSALFYLFFRYEHRFVAPLFPILAVLAAFGFVNIYKKINNKIFISGFFLILAVPLVLALRLSYLSHFNDSRIHLRQWVEKNIPAGSKILVYARLTRLPSSKEAIKEQELLDPQSLRKVDLAEANLEKRSGNFFHALNLYSVGNQNFYDNLEKYVRDNGYQYLLMSEADFRGPGRWNDFKKIAEGGKLLKSFGYPQEDFSLSVGQLIGNPFRLFALKEFGPLVFVYKLY